MVAYSIFFEQEETEGTENTETKADSCSIVLSPLCRENKDPAGQLLPASQAGLRVGVAYAGFSPYLDEIPGLTCVIGKNTDATWTPEFMLKSAEARME